MDDRRRRRRRRPRFASAPAAPSPEVVRRGVVVTAQRVFRVPAATAYGMASRLEHLPRWSNLWLRCDPVQRRGAQRTLRLRGFLAGLPVEAVVRAEVEPGRAVRWRQAYGTLLHYAASLEVEPAEEGCHVRYTVELDPGIEMLDEGAVRLVAVQEVEHTLDRMRWSAERERVAEEIRLMKAKPTPDASSPSAPETPAPPTEVPGPEEPAPQPGKRRRRRRRRRTGGGT